MSQEEQKDISSLNKKELIQLCKEKGIKGYSKAYGSFNLHINYT